MEATPATADPVAIPIVRGLVEDPEDELSVDEEVELATEIEDVVCAATTVAALPAGLLMVMIEAADAVSTLSVPLPPESELSVRLQVVFPWHEYPKGQHSGLPHSVPHSGSCPVRFVV